jgi:excisionase family DNA binding protein
MNAAGHPVREVCAEQSWPPRYLTVTEAAEAMSRHRSAVLRLIHTGKLPSIRLGRSYRIREAEVLRLRAEAMPGPADMLDAAECARILRCPERTINALVKLGHLDGECSGSDSCRVAVSEFQRFLRDAENRPASSAPGYESR